MVPFVDVKTVLSEFNAHGLPMVMDNTVTVPSGDDPDSFAFIDEPKIEESGYKEPTINMVQASLMIIRIARIFGMPILIEGETEDDINMLLDLELNAAGERAMTVQQNRNKRRARV
jgi:hypothetical protein